MSISVEEAGSYIGRTLYGTGGEKIGKIGQVYLDDESGQPEWVTVSTGLFGTKETFVPIADASPHDDGLAVPFTKDQVKDAPNTDLDGGHLSAQEEETLYRHYGREYSAYTSDATDTGYTETTTTTTASQRDVDTDRDVERGEGSMTRSEERLNVGTERVATGKARLRKYVETEVQQVDVPVRKEKVRLETETITDANRGDAFDGAEISEAEHEVTLTEERPVVSTEAVPVERVRLETDVVEETQTVDGEVRKERIELEGDADVDRTTRDRS